MLDLVHEGGAALLAIREAMPGATGANARLAAIAARYREAMPVRITRAADALQSDAPIRTLLAGGEEVVATGDTVVRRRAGAEGLHTRAPVLERAVRRLQLAWQRWRIRGYDDGSQALSRDGV